MTGHKSWHIEPQGRDEFVLLLPGDKQSRAKSLSCHRRGFSSILAVIFVSLFSVLGISFFSMTNINLTMADNHYRTAQAQAAAESGLAYAGYLIGSYIREESPYTFDQTLSQSAMTVLFTAFSD
ncbi:MAG: pilus assembly PilX N-terminal domain-containing protein, partial [Sedimentisphaerales bacterium]|nr:pilus assembly PilX N-terminal domain-containing protein [Sedimentisphaerales bacterium]